MPERVGVLCTRYAAAGGIFQTAAVQRRTELIWPSADMAEQVDRVIFGDLIRGDVSHACIEVFGLAVEQLRAAGAEAIILGNTDMTLAAESLQNKSEIPLVDAARAHARDAARAACSGSL